MEANNRRRMLILGVLLLMIVGLQGLTWAQDGSGTITGQLFGPTGEVLDKVEIAVEGLNLVAISNMEGSFLLANVPAGEQTLICSFIGLPDETVVVTVVAGQTLSQNITFNFGDEIDVKASPYQVGQAKALSKQKNAINITNVISADQIGQFPDKNAAEATQRIPGLTLYRDMGEGRYVLIRGTEPRLNSTTINGERIPSPEKDRRDVALDTIPADLLESIEVSKALTPDMDGDAIGGTVDLVTQRAPEKTRVSGSLGLGYNDLSGKTGYNGTFAWGQRFADQKFGVLVSASAASQERDTHNIEPEYDDGDLAELQMRAYQTKRERVGLTADFDWRVSDRSSYYLRTLFTNYQDDEQRRAKVEIPEDGEIERGLKERLQESDILSFTFGGENIVGTNLVIDYHVSRNTAKEETANQLTSVFIQEDVDFDPNVSADFIDPNNIYANPINEDINEFGFDEIEEEHKLSEEEDWVGAINFTQAFYRDADFSGLWKAGAKARLKTKDQDVDVWAWESEDDLMLSDFLEDWTTRSPFYNGQYDIGQFQDPDLMRAMVESGALESERILDEDLADFESSEDTYAAFGMVELIFGGKTTILGGVRVENTTTHYDAWELAFDDEGDPLELMPVSGGKDYTEWLPQFHLIYKIDNKSNLRAAITKTLARPNFDHLAPFRLTNAEDQEIEMGNVDLDVTTAWNLDLLYEMYLEPVGVFSAGVFYKDLTDNIFLFTFDEEIDGDTWEIVQPQNGDSATLWGAEFAYQNMFTKLKGGWSGLGLYANYTWTDSEARYPDRDEVSTLQGQSSSIGNLALIYEKYGFSGRLSFNHHGKYILEVGGGPDEDLWVDDHFQIDFTARQQLSDKINIFLEFINIDDEPFRVYEGTSDRTRQEEYYSWWAVLGIRINL
ncbi:MAG: TonB-dependent receptor [Acidobacteriota bacterium]